MPKGKDSFSWGDLKVEPVTVADADSIKGNSNGQVLSILFDKATLQLDGPDSPQVLTWVASFSIPVKIAGNHPSVYFREILRGFVQKDENARVLMVFDVGGQVYYRDHTYGKKVEKDLVLQSAFKITGQRLSTYTITLFVLIERTTPDSFAMVAIDSIDIEASFQKLSISETPLKRRREPNE